MGGKHATGRGTVSPQPLPHRRPVRTRGMGAVYRAWDTTLDVSAAIKENVIASRTGHVSSSARPR